MRLRISRRTKRKLASRFTYNVFVRLLIFKVWFRVACLGILALLVCLALFLLKLRTVSAPGTYPVIKLSGLDQLQAWSCKRAAQRETLAGKPGRAFDAWMAALGHNPTDTAALRGLLTNLITSPTADGSDVERGLQQGHWLLKLTHTNLVDLDLMTQVLERRGSPESVASLLAPLATKLGPKGQSAYLKALFSQGRAEEFARYWKEFNADQLNDSELLIYRAAYLAGWGTPAEAGQGSAKLREMADDPTYRVLVDRLQLSVAAKRSDDSRYEDSLARLQKLTQDNAIDHARFWRLLAAVGQQERALQLALAYAEPVRSAPECVALLEAFDALRLYDHARLCFHKAGREFWTSESVWRAYAAAVVDSKDWGQLQRLAVEMRTETRSELHLSGYSYFLEALAASEVGDRQQTEVALQKMNRFWTGNAALALECAGKLLQLGYAGAASELVAPFEPERGSDSSYWQLRFALASALKNHELLLQAASNRFNLGPQDDVALRQYATALLINRREPQLAASIANRLLALDPDSAPGKIDHARALLLNNQVAEARAALERLSGHAVSPPDATSLSWALFQVHFQSKEYQEAWRMLDKVDTNLLFRPDLAWLAECQNRMSETNAPLTDAKP